MTDELREATQQAPMAYYALVIKADSGYESTTEGRCTADQYGAAMAALHGTAALAQQDAQAVPTQRQYEMALRQWDHWKSYALELQAKLVKYEGGSPMVLNAAPTPPVQRGCSSTSHVGLTDEEVIEVWTDIALQENGSGWHAIGKRYARAIIEAYETKNGINRG